jgi:hypothetical protein
VNLMSIDSVASRKSAIGSSEEELISKTNNPLAAATNLLFLLENENLSEEGNTT